MPVGRNTVVYWTQFSVYESCPQQYLWRWGWEDIDVGGGPGKPKPIPDGGMRSEHHSIMGMAIQYGVEKLYNDKLWKKPGLEDALRSEVEKEFKYLAAKKYINWEESPSYDDMLESCVEASIRFVDTMKGNKLLGPYAESEKTVKGTLKGITIGGRIDIIFKRKDTGLTILDGKNSKYRHQYVDPNQVRFYALCYLLQYKKIADRVGFVFYQFPYDESKNETGIEWVECTKEDLEGLAHRVVKAKTSMIKRSFDPAPSPPICKFCDYLPVCDARQEQIEKNAAKMRESSAKKAEKFQKENSNSSGGGFFDLGF